MRGSPWTSRQPEPSHSSSVVFVCYPLRVAGRHPMAHGGHVRSLTRRTARVSPLHAPPSRSGRTTPPSGWLHRGTRCTAPVITLHSGQAAASNSSPARIPARHGRPRCATPAGEASVRSWARPSPVRLAQLVYPVIRTLLRTRRSKEEPSRGCAGPASVLYAHSSLRKGEHTWPLAISRPSTRS